jgi:hypothetical protein
MHRLLIAFTFITSACVAHVRSGPPPAEPAAPPPPPVVHDHRHNDTPPVPPAPPPAPPPPTAGQHTTYLQALPDLREARAFLVRPPGAPGKVDTNHAIRELEGAIREINEAGINDGKRVDEHPTFNPSLTWQERLKKASELNSKWRREINEHEGDAFAHGLKGRVVGHLDAAGNDIKAAMDELAGTNPGPTAPTTGAHPAYAAALTNLRHARALVVTRSGAADIQAAEQTTVAEIDATIKEIRDARRDDSGATEGPPVDSKVAYPDRLREAVKLLEDTQKDLEQREDNTWAKKDRRQAIDHLKKAIKAAKDAINHRRDHAAGH